MMQPAPEPKKVKRFYETASAAEADGGFSVLLDGRKLKTPAGRTLIVPTRPLAEAIAAEWNAQGEFVDISSLRLTRTANSAIDAVAGREAEVADEIVRYGSSDLLCYRAVSPATLAERQEQVWGPILAWADKALGISLVTTAGVTYCEQPARSIEALRAHILPLGPFRLAALNMMTTLSGSAILALACAQGHLGASEAWAAAHLDEDWQIAQWGEDYEAKMRRERRFADFEAASRFYHLSAGAP